MASTCEAESVVDESKKNEPSNARAFFVARSASNCTDQPPQLRTVKIQRRHANRHSTISQHIQLFECKTSSAVSSPILAPRNRRMSNLEHHHSSEEKLRTSTPVQMELLYVNLSDLHRELNGDQRVPSKPSSKKKPVPVPRRISHVQSVPVIQETAPLSPPATPARPAYPPPLPPATPSRQPNFDRQKSCPQISERRKTISNDRHLPKPSQLSTPLEEVSLLKKPSSFGDLTHLTQRPNSATSEPSARTPVKDLDFLKVLTQITDSQHKCMTLPNRIPRPLFSPQSQPILSMKPFAIEESYHISRRPLPEPPKPPSEDYHEDNVDCYSDTCTYNEPIYQELSEDIEEEKAAVITTPVSAQPSLLRKTRRCGRNFRSLRGLQTDKIAVKPKLRSLSFTTADLETRTQPRPYSTSCSSISLTESDSGVSLELESLRDDLSVLGLRYGGNLSTGDFPRTVEKIKGFQNRSESLNTRSDGQWTKEIVKNTISLKNRRHTLPISITALSPHSTVFDDIDDDKSHYELDYYPPRALWCQQPSVLNSGLLEELTDDQRKLQESLYEIISSEAAHLRYLNVAINVFKNAPEFLAATKGDPSLAVLSPQEERNLFLNIIDVQTASQSLFRDLHQRYTQHGSPRMPHCSDILADFAANQSKVYVKYCSDQLFQEKTLRGVRERKRFQEVIKRLEALKVCESLDFRSYLMLPMQRVTRLPLLISAVVKRFTTGTPEHTAYNDALIAMNKVVRECDEGAKRCACIEELCRIDAVLHFDVSLKKIPIISASRSLVKRGTVDVIQIEHKFLPRRTFHKKSLHLLLFNDLFLLTKPKGGSEEALVVVDHCPRNLLDCVQISPTERDDLVAHTYLGASSTTKNPEDFLGAKIVLLRNSAQKTVELFVIMTLESDYLRWMSVLNPSEKVDGDEKIYEIWDCPKYEVIADYKAKENDELSLVVGDVVDIYRKSSDGWMEGRKASDGHLGWLPTDITKELMTEHARARNLKERNRLLTASAQITKERSKLPSHW